MARPSKAVGARGSWFASVDGERLPCVHQHWIKRDKHFDPGYVEGDPQRDELVEAVRTLKRVIVTTDVVNDAPTKKSTKQFTRTGYVGVFRIDDVTADDAGLRFTLTQRLQDIR